ncbi:MAG: methylated-DNA--protein-cysteine methyltransferase [Labilithrix sp.]|nr:methylated-DNA--protein-cysteine methyltransferase [Labilithrix sp.]
MRLCFRSFRKILQVDPPRVALEARESQIRARVLSRVPDAREGSPPADVKRAIGGIVTLLEGTGDAGPGRTFAEDLLAITLDMEGVPPFHKRVYEVARTIPPGATVSYGEIAARLGSPGSARAVGQALGRNPFAIVVPCHRVLAAGGKVGGFSANGGVSTKLRMLAIESARADVDSDGGGTFAFDPRAAVEHVRASDPALARIIDTVGPFRMELKRTSSIFGALAEAIVHQQLTGKAAATIFARVCALFPRPHEGPSPDQILRVPDEKLRSAGLSRAKMLALRDLAEKVGVGELPSLAEAQRMDDDAIVERLTEVRGVGRWTAEMLLMFRLGRPDVLPVDDYGVRKGFAIALKKRALPAPSELAKYGVKWKPYRTVASWYLWRAVELDERAKRPWAPTST